MKLRWTALVCGALLLGGCLSEENYRKILDTWVGSTEAEIVDSWGTPHGFYERDGIRYLTYRRSKTALVGGSQPRVERNFVTGQPYLVGGSDPVAVDYWCETTFTVENRRVVSWRYRGNSCLASDPD